MLGLKQELYDVLVDLPPSYSKDAPEKIYPKITLSSQHQASQKQAKPIPIKATQRDVRRYLVLREGLKDLPRSNSSPDDDEDDFDNSSTFSSSSLIEPLSWPLLAYTSFIWWASAGEKGAGRSEDEEEQDSKLLSPDNDSVYTPGGRRNSISYQERDDRTREIALITYFRRLTTQIFTVLFDIVSRQDDGEDDDEGGNTTTSDEVGISSRSEDDFRDDLVGPSTANAALTDTEPLLPGGRSATADSSSPSDDEEIVPITTEDMRQMGLDPWSESDRVFVEELLCVWWGRKGQVQGGRVRCCGVRIL